ncbi:hypothetical protein RND81_06G099400 [Saponaria officinalis]|uniref:MACPF domain-containing protein n=1 Tax=Saponaria officinalis TaxID=3572 RepID=A0AAW1K8T6_SAPOF
MTDPSSAAVNSDALLTTLSNAIQAIGRGFDVTSDIRLLYCKGSHGSRLIQIDEDDCKDISISDDLVLPHVSVDIQCSCGSKGWEATPVWGFLEMSEYFNKRSGLSGSIPLGSFNAMFNFSGSWHADAAATKSLAMMGYFIPLYKLQLSRSQLDLRNEIKAAVPYSWDPTALASFIENYGTHVITSTTIGGRDVVYVRQHESSLLSSADIENYVKDIADQRFTDSQGETTQGETTASPMKYKDKNVTVIFRRRGGDDLEQSFAKWAETVNLAPDVIDMTFVPIVSLLQDVPGVKHLNHAIDLYLECKTSHLLKIFNTS